MKIQKFKLFESTIESKYELSNEDIIDYFIDYADNDQIEISDGWIEDNRFLHKKNHFSKADLGKTKRAKLVIIPIEQQSEDGIHIETNLTTMRSLDPLIKAISELKRFYNLTNEEINFAIQQEFNNTNLILIISYDFINEKDLTGDTIDGFLKEISDFMVNDKSSPWKNKKRIIKNNWVEFRFNSDRDSMYMWDVLSKMGNNQPYWVNGQPRYPQLDEINQRIQQAGYKISPTGGNKQTVITLKKI